MFSRLVRLVEEATWNLVIGHVNATASMCRTIQRPYFYRIWMKRVRNLYSIHFLHVFLIAH